MALRPSSVPLRVPLPPPSASSLPAVPDPESDLARAGSPNVPRLLASVVSDPSFESTATSALVAELVDFDAACHLDYTTSLVAESESDCPPSVRGECALGTDVLEDKSFSASASGTTTTPTAATTTATKAPTPATTPTAATTSATSIASTAATTTTSVATSTTPATLALAAAALPSKSRSSLDILSTKDVNSSSTSVGGGKGGGGTPLKEGCARSATSSTYSEYASLSCKEVLLKQVHSEVSGVKSEKVVPDCAKRVREAGDYEVESVVHRGEYTERSHSWQSRVARDQQGSMQARRHASTREARRAGRGGARLGKSGARQGKGSINGRAGWRPAGRRTAGRAAAGRHGQEGAGQQGCAQQGGQQPGGASSGAVRSRAAWATERWPAGLRAAGRGAGAKGGAWAARGGERAANGGAAGCKRARRLQKAARRPVGRRAGKAGWAAAGRLTGRAEGGARAANGGAAGCRRRRGSQQGGATGRVGLQGSATSRVALCGGP
ncbi:unnamed protein product [Closterium sp. NIES-54]